ncbi:MAG: CGGC domain-containing protein [Candidatus Electrothrix communis]|nr:MAG: CGGC domain-containing protein [Candidatus Electrothrix communis]
MAKIAILYCKKIKDYSCIACSNCFKGIAENNGEFARYKDEDIELVAMTDCGGCPGLTVPRVKLLKGNTSNIGRPMEVVHLGTCMKAAMETADCPIAYDDLKINVEKKFGVKVVLGTHDY